MIIPRSDIIIPQKMLTQDSSARKKSKVAFVAALLPGHLPPANLQGGKRIDGETLLKISTFADITRLFCLKPEFLLGVVGCAYPQKVKWWKSDKIGYDSQKW